MATLTLSVADDLIEKLSAGGNEPAQRIRLGAAFFLCSQGQLTTSQGARLAGLTYAEFLEAAARAKYDLFQYTAEELEQELAHPLPDGIDTEAIKEELARARAAGG